MVISIMRCFAFFAVQDPWERCVPCCLQRIISCEQSQKESPPQKIKKHNVDINISTCYNANVILILDQPIDKLSAIISSFCVKLPCQATACLRSLSKVNGVTLLNLFYLSILSIERSRISIRLLFCGFLS